MFLIGLTLVFIFARAQEEDDVFSCKILDPLKMRIGNTIYIPANSTAPFAIPPNFNCTYKFHVPSSAYLRVSVINNLADSDSIEFADSLGFRKNMTNRAIANEEFFATIGEGYLRVQTGAGGRSKALLEFEWLKLPSSQKTQYVLKNASGISIDCQDLQQSPITFTTRDANETIALSIAHSGFILDNFDSFFIFDGNDTNSRVVGRMSNFILTQFSPTNQTATILGLTSKTVYSNLMVNVKSNLARYQKYSAVVVIDQQGATLDSINQTVAFTFVAKDSNQLYMTSLKFNEIETNNCKVNVISGTPSPISTNLLFYTPNSPLEHSFPQQFPANLFSIELTDCSIYMVISKNQPKNFYEVESGRVGYAFTPSYLDASQTSELNFTLRSNDTLTYSTVVESVDVCQDSQLAINVYNSKGISAMSIVITGNQTGGSAQAIGTSVNIQFNSSQSTSGSAKIRYFIGINSSFSARFSAKFLTIFVVFFISFL